MAIYIPAGYYVSSLEIAEQCGVTHSYVCRLARQKKIDALRLGKEWLVPEGVYKRWLEEQSKRYVYIIRGKTTGLIKVGTSRNVKNRLIQLKAQVKEGFSVLHIFSGGRKEEKKIIDTLLDYRVKHPNVSCDTWEWFVPSSYVLEQIDILRETK